MILPILLLMMQSAPGLDAKCARDDHNKCPVFRIGEPLRQKKPLTYVRLSSTGTWMLCDEKSKCREIAVKFPDGSVLMREDKVK